MQAVNSFNIKLLTKFRTILKPSLSSHFTVDSFSILTPCASSASAQNSLISNASQYNSICCRKSEIQWNSKSSTQKPSLLSRRSQQYTQSFTQKRFYHQENSELKKNEFTEEEIKVLKDLEEEEAQLKTKTANNLKYEETESENLKESISQTYVPFEDQQRIIQDVIEEIWNPLPEPEKVAYQPPEEFLRRGKSGVFDLSELIDLVKNENGTEIVTISLPKELDYADYMVIVTAMGPRHLLALATYVRKRFKIKNRKQTDIIPAIVSKNGNQGWIALDLGNIILHMFLQEQRDYYDLELLWTVGPLFDDLCNAKDPEIIQLLNMMK